MEIFNTIYDWIMSNIVPLLTTTNLVALVGVFIGMRRQKSTLFENTLSTRDLKKSLAINNELKEKIDSQAAEISDLKALAGDLSDLMYQTIVKSNAMLDVQQIVYNASTSLTAEARSAINNTIVNAKYATTKARADIIKEIDEMKKAAEKTAVEQQKKAEKIRKLVQSESDNKPASLVNFD